MTSAIGAILRLLMPVILFAGILFGLATPTEVSSFALCRGSPMFPPGALNLGG
jgi:TRAP-type C4-dicarboxylate transport system permease large subunit